MKPHIYHNLVYHLWVLNMLSEWVNSFPAQVWAIGFVAFLYVIILPSTHQDCCNNLSTHQNCFPQPKLLLVKIVTLDYIFPYYAY